VQGDFPGVRSKNCRPATLAARGAIRQASKENFFDRIKHYINEGDTALHMAAAAKQTGIADELISRGADVRARNRRGAEPLHYAVDGGPGSPVWDPNEQTMIIVRLIRAGADPNATDKSGVAPLHRAVRNRCAAAVRALIEGGADPRTPNRNGSTNTARDAEHWQKWIRVSRREGAAARDFAHS
jgi:hypothetical protein